MYSSFFTCSIMMDKTFLSLSWVEKWEFRLVYMYGKEIREGNKKEKGNKRGKWEGKGVETRGKENKKGKWEGNEKTKWLLTF